MEGGFHNSLLAGGLWGEVMAAGHTKKLRERHW